jgi:hypothetical protein
MVSPPVLLPAQGAICAFFGCGRAFWPTHFRLVSRMHLVQEGGILRRRIVIGVGTPQREERLSDS